MKKIKLKINGMHCSSCAMLIDGDLEDLEGVKSAQTSFHKQECEIEIDGDKVDINKLIETVKNTGYKAETA